MMHEEAESAPVPDTVLEQGLVTCGHADLEKESDDGLLTYMALKSVDEEQARRACEELHHRHARYLLRWCVKYRRETFGGSAEDFVNITFVRAYQEAEGFVRKGPKKRRTQVLAWLFRILKNVYLDSLRAERCKPVMRSPDGEGEWIEGIADRPVGVIDQPLTRRQALVLEYLETLPAKDREILIATSEFWDREKMESAIDEDVRAGICQEHGLTECSLRVRRKRLIDAGKAFVHERENQQQNTPKPR